jgi:glucose/mannose-6-phosphate isomerase
MGGSGIGGAFVASILKKTSKVVIVTNSDYSIPGWVDKDSLVVACSNSGNTEETLSATNKAIKRGAVIACITSGGMLEELALKSDLPFVKVPGGFPPRSQFAYSLLSLAWTLVRFKIFPENLYNELEKTADSTSANSDYVVERAQMISDLVEGKNINIYSDTNSECIALRWRQQLNENSKLLVNSHVFPELNHNELVGWASGSEQDVVVILRTQEDSERTKARMDLSAEIFQEMGADVVFVDPDGEDQMQRLMDLVFLGDMVSLLLAESAGVDPVEIENIDRLKNKLSEL